LKLASSAPAVLGFFALVIYGIVRVGHDAFYGTFGVTPEDAGLTQTTIIGRAALYFVLFLVATLALVGLSVAVARLVSAIEAHYRRRHEGDPPDAIGRRVDFVLLVLAALVGVGAAVLAGMEDSWWPLAFTTGFIVVLALSGLVGRRFTGKGQLLAGLVFASVTAWAGSVAYVVAKRGAATEDETLGPVARWVFFLFCVGAATTASTSLLRNLQRDANADDATRQISFAALSLLAALPFAVAFIAPGAGDFITADNNRLAVATAMWAALFGVVVVGFRLLRRGRSPAEALLLISLICVAALASLFLARERGLDLASQVFQGSRITQTRFGLFSARASIVCLEGSSNAGAFKWPYVYLGQSQGALVLFDIRRREESRVRAALGEKGALGAVKGVPVFIPASGVTVQVATLLHPSGDQEATGGPHGRPLATVVPVDINGYHDEGKWRCPLHPGGGESAPQGAPPTTPGTGTAGAANTAIRGPLRVLALVGRALANTRWVGLHQGRTERASSVR
jgi:hypothetical protein